MRSTEDKLSAGFHSAMDEPRVLARRKMKRTLRPAVPCECQMGKTYPTRPITMSRGGAPWPRVTASSRQGLERARIRIRSKAPVHLFRKSVAGSKGQTFECSESFEGSSSLHADMVRAMPQRRQGSTSSRPRSRSHLVEIAVTPLEEAAASVGHWAVRLEDRSQSSVTKGRIKSYRPRLHGAASTRLRARAAVLSAPLGPSATSDTPLRKHRP